MCFYTLVGARGFSFVLRKRPRRVHWGIRIGEIYTFRIRELLTLLYPVNNVLRCGLKMRGIPPSSNFWKLFHAGGFPKGLRILQPQPLPRPDRKI